LLTPYTGHELVRRLKVAVAVPIHIQCHATTGMSTATYLKCIEAGIDNVDTAISSMSMTYGHSPTEALVAILQGTDRDTGLDLPLLEEIAAYFREVRRKYARFEGSLKGIDSRILVAQVPGGMLTNMENQLREQGAAERMDEVLAEIPRVREELGFIPLVTPTSQIVGTQAVLNVLSGERYKVLSQETEAVLKGEYGATPAPVDAALRERVLAGAAPIECRPADLLGAEFDRLREELLARAAEQNLRLADGERELDDVLTYALFPQVGLRFLTHRGDPSAFEPVPDARPEPVRTDDGEEVYTVTVEGRSYTVTVAEGGDVSRIMPIDTALPSPGAAGQGVPASGTPGPGTPVPAPLAGTVVKVLVTAGETVAAGQRVLMLEAMKMETAVSAPGAGTVTDICVKAGDQVAVGDTLLAIA